MAGKVVLIGTFDTKGQEYLFVKNILEQLDIDTLTINTGVLDVPLFTPDISSDQVARAAGSSLEELVEAKDRGKAVAVMTKGIQTIIKELIKVEQIDGVFGMGGTAGTTVASAGMKALPVGIPKLLVSTVASGNTRPYVGVKDVTMMYSVIDIAGLNKISRKILKNAAFAIAGMAGNIALPANEEESKKMIGLTMFGVTTPCCTMIRELLEKKGYDVLVFHATGTGGLAMEELIREGFIEGVIDVTTTELADELVGGIFTAGPDRLLAAGEAGIPQVVSVGALDMVNFGPPETVPEKFSDRHFYQHNPTTTLMRTTVKENEILGKQLAEKVNNSTSPVVLFFPKGGISLLDTENQDFYGPEQREALLTGIKNTLNDKVQIIEVEEDINHPSTADKIAKVFMELLENQTVKEGNRDY